MSTMASQTTCLTIQVYLTFYSKGDFKKSRLRATGLCEENSPVTGEFPAQKAGNAENVSFWWRHDGLFHSPNLVAVALSVWYETWWGCFTNVSRALQKNLAKIYNARNHIYSENFKLKLCTCAQSMGLGTRTKFQLEILIRSTISAIQKFREIILESSRNVSETTPWPPTGCVAGCVIGWSKNRSGSSHAMDFSSMSPMGISIVLQMLLTASGNACARAVQGDCEKVVTREVGGGGGGGGGAATRWSLHYIRVRILTTLTITIALIRKMVIKSSNTFCTYHDRWSVSTCS